MDALRIRTAGVSTFAMVLLVVALAIPASESVRQIPIPDCSIGGFKPVSDPPTTPSEWRRWVAQRHAERAIVELDIDLTKIDRQFEEAASKLVRRRGGFDIREARLAKLKLEHAKREHRAARGDHERFLRKRGIRINAGCLENPLANGCM